MSAARAVRVSIAFRLKEWHGGGRARRGYGGNQSRLNRLSDEGVARRGAAIRIARRNPPRRVSIAFRLKEWHGDADNADNADKRLNRLSAEGVARRRSCGP